MNSDDAMTLLLDTFPEVGQAVADFTDAWRREGDGQPPGIYSIVGDVVMPSLIEPMFAHSADRGADLSKLFALLEQMLTNGDDEVVTLVRFGICERFGDSEELWAVAQRYMGPRTRQTCDQTEAEWGRQHPR